MNHDKQWKQIQTALANQRIPQAMLFVGPLHCGLNDFTQRVIQLFLCKKRNNEPCLTCIDCSMVAQNEHPDEEWIKPEKEGGAIKIDQIRALQHSIYLMPQRAEHRVIVIESAERMNSASANALLKILEEPAPQIRFILIAQQLGTILPTVLSRCQITYFNTQEDMGANYLLLGSKYPEDAKRALIMTQAESILENLIAIIEQREYACAVAIQWAQFELDSLLWFLYLVYSQLQIMHSTHYSSPPHSGPAIKQLRKLASLLNPVSIFKQIDKINALLRKLNHNISVNQALAIEDLLLSLE